MPRSSGPTRRLGRCGLPLAAWLLLAPGGCQKQPLPPLQPPAVPDLLEQGEERFQQGDLAGAAVAYRAYLSAHPSGTGVDLALSRLALAYLLPASPVHDPVRARTILEHLAARGEGNPYAAQARLIVNLEEELRQARDRLRERERSIRRLTEELERLKEIDLGR